MFKIRALNQICRVEAKVSLTHVSEESEPSAVSSQRLLVFEKAKNECMINVKTALYNVEFCKAFIEITLFFSMDIQMYIPSNNH